MKWPKENIIIAVALIEEASRLLLNSRMAEHIPEHKDINNLQARTSNLLGVAREVKKKVLNMPE